MATPRTSPKAGNLSTTLATWIYLLYDSARLPEDKEVREACERLRAAGVEVSDESVDIDEIGQRLVSVIEGRLAGRTQFDEVLAWVGTLFPGRLITDMGVDRDARVQSARSYQFQNNLPWLARIVDRFPDGSVGGHWVMVERVTDGVTCMDPYPWDDLDEEYTQPVTDFMVKWELAGCQGIRWTRA